MTIFAIPRAHTFAPQIKFNKHSSYSLFFNCSKCSYWLLLKIFIFILESASGCLGIYCFISIIPCVVRILPFQTILLPFCYCSPARRRALTHTCTDNLSQYQAPQNHRSSDFTYLKGKEFQDINSTTQIVFTYATTYSVLQQDMGSWCEIIIMTRDLPIKRSWIL